MADAATLLRSSIGELAPRIRTREVSPVEVTEAALAHLEELQPKLSSFVTLVADRALSAARAREAAIRAGDYRGPLDGIPIGIKDAIATRGIRSTCGTKALVDYVPSESAPAVEKLEDAGAIVLGKENMHELASGGTSTNPHYGAVRNPWNLDYTPGGSSGGSGANVSAGITFASLGGDVGGSIRYPAHCCNVVGLKPSFGRVSQRGSLATGFWGQHLGPIARTVSDCALVLQAIAGYDSLDPTSVPVPVPDFSDDLARGVDGLRIGLPLDHYFDLVDDDVERVVHEAVRTLEALGATVVEVRLPHATFAEVFWVGLIAETCSLIETMLRERRSDLTYPLSVAALSGQFLSAKDYLHVQKWKLALHRDFAEAFQLVDVIATPPAPTPAIPIGAESIVVKDEVIELTGRDSVLGRDLCLSNATGHPAICVPADFTQEGLPIGLQLIGRHFDEAFLLRVAATFEAHSPAAGKWPPIAP
jgi:aspartyl-tRNA(Asn)/glutamyl-tRNA(Gln) amidotransferase subunit A